MTIIVFAVTEKGARRYSMYLITIYTKGGNTLIFKDEKRDAFVRSVSQFEDDPFIRVNFLEDGADEYVRASSIELISVEEIDG